MAAGQHRKHRVIRVVVLFKEYVIAFHAHLGWNVAVLGGAHERVYQQAVGDLLRAFRKVFVGAMNGVPRLEGDYRFPAAPLELGSRLHGGESMLREHRIVARCDHVDLAGQADLP